MVGLLILTLLWAATELLSPASTPVPGEPQLAFWNFAIPAALSIGNALINRGGDKKGSAGERRMGAQASRDRARGGAAEDAYYDRISRFDATEGAQRTADVLTADWQRQDLLDAESLRGRNVAMGRLDTGYAVDDEERRGYSSKRHLSDSMARLAMQTQAQQREADESLGRYGERVTGRGIDLDMTAEDRRRSDRASRRSMWGNIGGALIQAGGQYLGNRGGGGRSLGGQTPSDKVYLKKMGGK